MNGKVNLMTTKIKDIAQATGLSVTTVSLVLNNKADKIPERTKKLIKKTAKEMNYRPNQIAISLVKKKTKTLGLLIPDIRNSFFSMLAKEVEDECHKMGWTMILCNTGDHHHRDLDYINVLASKNVDGVIYCMASDTTIEKFHKVHELLAEYKLPYIMIDRTYNVENVHAARIDNRLGGFLATEHLISLGHRKIACITGPMNLMDTEARLSGYKDALAKYGIPYDPNLIYQGNYQMSGGVHGITELKNEAFTAVFAFNDLMAFGAYKALKLMKKKIPEDVSLVGYDDIIFSEMLEVSLTTIRQPIGKAGKLAVRFIIDYIDDPSSAEEVPILSPKLIKRDSTSRRIIDAT